MICNDCLHQIRPWYRAQNEKGRESKEDAELDEKEREGGWEAGLITLSIARDSSSFAVAVLCCAG